MAKGGHGFPKVSPGPPCPTFLCPASGPPPKQPDGRFRGGPPAGRAACSHLPSLQAPRVVRLWNDSNHGVKSNDGRKPFWPEAKRFKALSRPSDESLNKTPMNNVKDKWAEGWEGRHRRMGRGGHGLPKVSPGAAMPTLLRPLERQAAFGRLLPFWTPHAVRLWKTPQTQGTVLWFLLIFRSP
jgi:hypothetical protein